MLRTTAVLLAALSFAARAGAAGPGAPPLPELPSGDKGGLDFEVLRKGVVQVEQAGRPVAVGTVLSRDGRILTALSALGAADTFDLRYADNSVVKAKVGHKDKAYDLALLVPQTGRWLDGLMPTDVDPNGSDIKAFLPKAGKLSGVGVGLRGRTDARSKEGDPLPSVLDVDLKGLVGVPGAPLLDPKGRVVGVLVRACKDTPGPDTKSEPKAEPAKCTPVTIGAPVPALRSFLMKTPTTAVAPAPWLGLGGAPADSGNVKGIRVMGIAPGSPAEKAGLKAGEGGDTIVAVDGQPVETPEQLAELIAKRGIGQTVKLLVFSGGKFREAAATLRAAP